MRIALFGGSFDPPHLGHLAIARAAREALHLDRVLFAPVGLQPLKPTGSSADFEDRVAMTRLAISSEPAFALSLIDSPEHAPNYTRDTLLRLRPTLPVHTELFFLLGADSFRSLARWQHAAEIPFLATLIVASRPGEDLTTIDALRSALPASLTLVAEPHDDSPPLHYRLCNTAGCEADLFILPNLNYDISATALRRQIHREATTEPAPLTEDVLQYIHTRHLYE